MYNQIENVLFLNTFNLKVNYLCLPKLKYQLLLPKISAHSCIYPPQSRPIVWREYQRNGRYISLYLSLICLLSKVHKATATSCQNIPDYIGTLEPNEPMT